MTVQSGPRISTIDDLKRLPYAGEVPPGNFAVEFSMGHSIVSIQSSGGIISIRKWFPKCVFNF